MKDNCIIDPACIPCIPHATIDDRYVDDRDMLRKYPGYYVTVRNENATYHVGRAGKNCAPNAVVVARTPIFRDGYDPAIMPKYRMNTVYDFLNDRAFIFDNNMDYRTITLGAI